MSRRPRLRRRAGGVLVLLGLILLLALAGIWTYLGPGPSARSGETTTVILERGSGVRQIGRKLEKAGVIRWSGAFVLAARASGAAGKLKAGEYQIASHASLARILDDIRAGRVVRHLITIPEGWTSAMALEAVNAAPELVGTDRKSVV